MTEKKERSTKYAYEFQIAFSSPDNTGLNILNYQLDEYQYNSVQKQIRSKDNKIQFKHADGEPMAFNTTYPVVYIKTAKLEESGSIVGIDGQPALH